MDRDAYGRIVPYKDLEFWQGGERVAVLLHTSWPPIQLLILEREGELLEVRGVL